ncbi:Uncharacterized protein Rs2_06017 [Raphanus sativus]|nr:Uncharacterized protein Rs2_06017 [Raphanus sativus]
MKVKEQRKKDDPSNNPKEDDDLSTETIDQNENPRIVSKTHHQNRTERDAMRKKRDQSGSDTILELVKLKLKLDKDGDERKKKRIIDTFLDTVMSVVLTKTEIIGGNVDGSVRTYDMRLSREMSDNLGQPVNCISISNDGNCVLAGCLDSTLRLLDRTTGVLLQVYKGHISKVVWITGVNQGIGEALAKQFASLGAKLILSDRTEAEMVRLKSELKVFL